MVGACEQPAKANEQANEPPDEQANERANEQADEPSTLASEPLPDERSSEWELRLDGVILRASTLADSAMLPYVRMILRLIEGVQFSRRQLVEWLRRAVRQHRLADRTRAEYVLHFLHQHPP